MFKRQNTKFFILLLALAILSAPLFSVSKVLAAPRCASESSSGNLVVEGSCDGYYTGSFDNRQDYDFKNDGCYHITRPEDGPNDFNIQEVPCSEFESLLRTPDTSNFDADCDTHDLNKENCGIVAYIVLIIRILSGLVGIVIILMLIIGGIQYTTAQNNPQSVAAARQRILNAVLALVAFLFAFAFLQWIVPGGVL